MKKILAMIFAGAMLAGCSTTTVTETTYKDDGQTIASVKVTETSGNPFVILAQNSKDKNWVLHQGGWGFNIGYADWGVNGGSLDNTVASFTGEANAVGIAKVAPAIVDSSKYTLTVSADGIEAENNGARAAVSGSEIKIGYSKKWNSEIERKLFK